MPSPVTTPTLVDAPWKPMPSPSAHDALVVAVTPRRTRVLLFSALTFALVVSLTLVFLHGVELERFDSHAKSQDAQTKLANDYNSYSGTIATVFAKPIDQFVGMAVQLVALRVVAPKLTQSELSWRLKMTIVGAAAAVGFLVGNGLNALNVQLRPQEVRPIIVPADLAAAEDAMALANSSTIERVIDELTGKNPTANTMLRNLVLAPAPRLPTQCAWETTSDNSEGEVPYQSLQSGFPRRDWFPRVLPNALSPKALQLTVTATDKTANAKVRPADLPMNASLAAELVLYSMLHAQYFFPFGDQGSFEVIPDFFKRYPNLEVTQHGERHRLVGPMAEVLGLLPNSTATKADETAQREQLLRESVVLAARQFGNANIQGRPVALSNIAMEFSHVDISPSVQFDAVTWEFEALSKQLATGASKDNSTLTTTVDAGWNCGPWPGSCLIEKVQFSSLDSTFNESKPQVQALSPCVSDDGSERIIYDLISTEQDFLHSLICPRKSNSSMLVFSFGKRLVADAVAQVKIRADNDTSDDEDVVTMTNLRKVYSFTVGRLAWQGSNLADANHAACASPDQCLGLQLPLAKTSASEGQQQLVVGVNALPLERFAPMGDVINSRPKYVQLAEVYEPTPTWHDRALGGDPLLPQNIGKMTWPRTTPVRICSAAAEDRVRLIVDNHYYSEYSLQPAYTAATFFLFQNAVVRDIITLDNGLTSLNFAANVQRIAVWVSTPKLNAWLTLAGCMLLAIALLAAITKSYWSSGSDPLEVITDAHVIARVVVDEEQFPPTLLHRRVVRDPNEATASRAVSECAIQSLSLERVDERTSWAKPANTERL